MRMILFSAFALGALTSTTWAEPLRLSDEQMDSVAAGGSIIVQNFQGTYVVDRETNGAADVAHRHEPWPGHNDVCTPGACRFNNITGKADTHVDVTPRNQ